MFALKGLVVGDISFIENLPSCDSEFYDPHHKHIVSGDLRVITNPKLRTLFSKSQNKREQETLN